MGSSTIDSLDRKIIHALYLDPRVSFSRLSEVLGPSEQTIARRYRRLFDARVVRVVGQIDSQRLGQSDWVVRIRCAPGSAPTVANRLAEHPDTAWVQLTSGGTEIFSTIHSRNRELRTPLLLSQLSVGRQVVALEAYCLLHIFATGTSPPPASNDLSPAEIHAASLTGTEQGRGRTLGGHAARRRLATRRGARRRRPSRLPTAGGANPLARVDRPAARRGTRDRRRSLLRRGSRHRGVWTPFPGSPVDVRRPRQTRGGRAGAGAVVPRSSSLPPPRVRPTLWPPWCAKTTAHSTSSSRARLPHSTASRMSRQPP